MDVKKHASVSESETMASNSGDRKFFCPEEGCGKYFSRPYRLEIHLRTHTGERPFKCDVPGCNKSYCRQPHLLRHQFNAHQSQEEHEKITFICEEEGCGIEFTQYHNLQKHLKQQHSMEAMCRYKCRVKGCKESFKKHHQLRAHSYTHTSIDPYKCSHPGCLRTFLTTARLRRHLKTHQGYECDEEGCNLYFIKWSDLRRHKSTDHIEEHKCKECGKAYPKQHLLNDHLRSRHVDKAPLSCPHDNCDRMYWDKRNLKAHIRRYHQVERFTCDEENCDKTFASKQRLAAHIKTHSPDYSPPVKVKKEMRSRKPARRTNSMASKLSGIWDMEIQQDPDPIILEKDDTDGVSASNSQDCKAESKSRLRHSGPWGSQQSDTVIMQTDWGKVLKLQDFPSACAGIPEHTSNCLASEFGAGEERSMEVGSGTGSAGCVKPDCVFAVPVMPPQTIISAPVIAFDSDRESESSGRVTLTAL